MISSTMPSAKYSCSGSPLMFWNGSTAIDGLSGNGSGARAVKSEVRAMLSPAILHIEHAHRPRDVLDLLLAPVVKAETELVAHLVAHDAADADAARARQRLEAGGDVDAVAIDVLPVLDDVAEIDADAKLDPPVGRLLGVAQRHLALHVDGAAHRVDDAGELDQQPVAGDPDDAAAVLLDHRVGELAAQHPQPLEGALLVLADEPRVADDIRCQDRRQSALYPRFTHQPAQPKREPPRFDAASRPTPPLSGMPPHQRL